MDKISDLYWAVYSFVRDNLSPRHIRRNIRFTWQIWTRGWCDCDTWSLGDNIADFVLPRLKKFKEQSITYPFEITPEEWLVALDRMIFSFDLLVRNRKDESQVDIKDWDNFQEGIDLFCKYYKDLWW